MAFPDMAHVTGDEKKEDVGEEGRDKIRVTITSANLGNLQKACNDLTQKLKKEKTLKMRGPIPMPRRRLRVTTRRAPCGNGTETYDHFELRVYKRIIDFEGHKGDVKHVTAIQLPPGVNVEVTLKTN